MNYRVITSYRLTEMHAIVDEVNLSPCGSFKTEGGSISVGGGEAVVEDKPAVKTNVYPNPFSETATFTFELKETSVVKIVVYDLSGKVIKIVANGEFSQGANQVPWNGHTNSDAPAAAGVYFYRIEAGNDVSTNRIILTR